MAKGIIKLTLVAVVLMLLAAAVPVSAAPPAEGPAAAARQDPANTSASEVIHIVQRGETLYRISLQYGVSMASLVAANNLINPSRIYAGQRLIIPTSSDGVPSVPAQGTPVQHVVQRGETLSIIARRYGVSMWGLAQANNISNPSLLYAGTVLVIQEGSSTPPANPEPAPAPPAGSTTTHIVQRGETLGTIAQRYGTTIGQLLAYNNIPNANRIYVGQRLTVPGEGSPPPPAPNAPSPTVQNGKQIVIVLSQQRVYAFENGQLVNHFVVSTGLPRTPTVTGDYAIYLKLPSQRMRGPGYDLPNVPWVMYFYRGYGLHGTYWHNNFGQPMSHGCVNMVTAEAQWMYEWAPLGTPVRVIN